MNAENRKLAAANVAQRSTLFEQNRPRSRWKCHDVLQLSSVTQRSRRRRGGSAQSRGPEGPGPNLRRCHNPSITRQQSTVKRPDGAMVHLPRSLSASTLPST